MTDPKEARERALTLAAICGLKIALGPAFLSSSRRWPSSGNWVTAALGEMALDKIGVFPPRWRPSLLIPHTLAGAWTAQESLKADGVDDPSTVAVGAGVAAGVAIVAPLIRIAANRGLGIPDMVLGLAEDALAVYLGSKVVGLSMGEVGQFARESVEEVRDKIQPALEKVGVGT